MLVAEKYSISPCISEESQGSPTIRFAEIELQAVRLCKPPESGAPRSPRNSDARQIGQDIVSMLVLGTTGGRASRLAKL